MNAVARCVVEEADDLLGIEAQQAAPLQERDTALGNEPPYVPLGDTQTLSKLRDIEQPRNFTRSDRAHSPHARTSARDSSSRDNHRGISRDPHASPPIHLTASSPHRLAGFADGETCARGTVGGALEGNNPRAAGELELRRRSLVGEAKGITL